MKIDKITVNRSEQKPDGLEIEIVKPEGELQGRVLSYLLASHIREAKRAGNIPYELPDQFTVEHKGEGTFVVSGNVGGGEYYHPPRPLAIVGIQTTGNRFEMIHAQIKPDDPAPPPEAPQAAEAESSTTSDQTDT